MIIHNKENTPIHFIDGIPPGYDEPVISGTNMLYAINNQTRVFIQQFVSSQYSFQYVRFCLRHHENLAANIAADGFHLLIAMENNIILMHHHHSIKVTKDQGLFWSGNTIPAVASQPGSTYRLFTVNFSPAMAVQLNEMFRQYADHELPLPHLFSHAKPFYLTTAIRDIIRQVMENPYDEATCRLYFNIKMKELFFVLMQYQIRSSRSGFSFTDYELSRIAEARKLLLKDLSKKPYTISQLARLAGINSFKLKIGFRQLYGTGVFECLQEKRMEYAKELLLNTAKPIKEICAMAGYPRMTNFITAFRRKFGYTPGSLRRK